MRDSSAVLVTRPSYDPLTIYLHAWSKEALSMAKKKGFKICDLEGANANRERFESYVRAHGPVFIFLNGHGNAQELAGQDDKVIVSVESDVGDALVYARSCDCAQKVGPALVTRGATFIGYLRKFVFYHQQGNLKDPLKDSIAALFLAPSNLVPSTLLKGHSAAEAHQRSKEAMYRNFRRMVSSASSFEERFAARAMWGNIKDQVLLGDENASIDS